MTQRCPRQPGLSKIFVSLNVVLSPEDEPFGVRDQASELEKDLLRAAGRAEPFMHQRDGPPREQWRRRLLLTVGRSRCAAGTGLPRVGRQGSSLPLVLPRIGSSRRQYTREKRGLSMCWICAAIGLNPDIGQHFIGINAFTGRLCPPSCGPGDALIAKETHPNGRAN